MYHRKLWLLTATTASAVSAAEASGDGYWTDWINADDKPQVGTGEFEDTARIKLEQNDDRKCYLGCEKPIACRYSVADAKTSATWTDIGMSSQNRFMISSQHFQSMTYLFIYLL